MFCGTIGSGVKWEFAQLLRYVTQALQLQAIQYLHNPFYNRVEPILYAIPGESGAMRLDREKALLEVALGPEVPAVGMIALNQTGVGQINLELYVRKTISKH